MQTRLTSLILCAAASLASCQRADNVVQPGTVQPPAASSTLPSTAPRPPEQARRDMLLGDWYVTVIDAESAVAGAPSIEVAIREKTIFAKSQCVYFDWEYTQSDQRIWIKPRGNIPVVRSGDRRKPVRGMCARALSSWETRFSKAMLVATDVFVERHEITRISGAGGTIRMRRK